MEFIQHSKFILRKEDISYINQEDGYNLTVMMKDGKKFVMKFSDNYDLDKAFNKLCLKTEAIPLHYWKNCLEQQITRSNNGFLDITNQLAELIKELRIIKKHLKLKDSNK